MTTIEFDYSKVLINQDGQLCVYGHKLLTHDSEQFKSVDPHFIPINTPLLRLIIHHELNINGCTIRAITKDNVYIVITIIDAEATYTVVNRDCLAVAYDYPSDLAILSTSGRVSDSTGVRWIGTHIDSDDSVYELMLIGNKFYECGGSYFIGEVDSIKMIRDSVMLDEAGRSFVFVEDPDINLMILTQWKPCIDACRDSDNFIYLLDDKGIVRKYKYKYYQLTDKAVWKLVKIINTRMEVKRLIRDDIVTGYGVMIESVEGEYYQLDDLKKIEFSFNLA